MNRRALLACAAIATLAAVLTLHRLGAADVCLKNEAHDGVFVQLMVERGELIFPLQNGLEPMFKPPLFHWSATALHRILNIGKVTPTSLRLAAALYAVAGVILAMIFAWWALGPRGAVFTGLALIACYHYVEKGRIGRVDMTLTFFESLGLFSIAWWLGGAGTSDRDSGSGARGVPGSRGFIYLAALALGLAVLSKGPVGAILPSLAVLVYLSIERRWSDLRALISPGPLAVGVAVASSWYLACYFAGYSVNLRYQLGIENYGRFVGNLGAMPPWYYVAPSLIHSPVVSALAALAVLFAIARNLPVARDLHAASNARARVAVRLFAIFWVVTLVLFSLAAYKRRVYLLPLWPSSAVLIAWLVDGASHLRWRARLRGAYVAVCLALAAGNFVYIPYAEVEACKGRYPRIAAAKVNQVVARDQPLYMLGFTDWIEELLFHLDRDAPRMRRDLVNRSDIYVLTSIDYWKTLSRRRPDLVPLLVYTDSKPEVVVLKWRPRLASP